MPNGVEFEGKKIFIGLNIVIKGTFPIGIDPIPFLNVKFIK